MEPAEPFTSTWIRVESAVTGLARPLLIGAVYIRPGHALLRDTWTALKRLVDTAKAVGHVVLMGDFNARLDTAAFAGRAARGGAPARPRAGGDQEPRSEEHTSEFQSQLTISYAVFCLKKKSTRLNSSHS